MRRILIIIAALLCTAPLLAQDADKLAKQVEKLTRQNKELQEKLSKSEVKRLSDEINTLRSSSQHQRQADSLLIDSLQRDLEALSMFRQEFVKYKLIAESPDYALPYSQVSLQQIDDYNSKLQTFKGDAEVDQLIAQTATYRKYKVEYESYVAILNQPFNVDDINTAYNRITKELPPLVGTDINEAQMAEIDTLKKFMTRFNQGVIDFQDLIKTIDERTSSYKADAENKDNIEFCIRKVNVIIGEKQADIDKRIKNIPYLNQRFDIYMQNMLTNPLVLTDDTRRIVNEINNDNHPIRQN